MSAQDEKLETTALVPVDRTQLSKFESEWKAYLAEFAEVPCGSAEEAAWWTAWRNEVHEQLTARDGERKEVTGPLYREYTTINGWYNNTGTPAAEFKALANKKLSDYALAQEAASTAAAAAAELAAQAGDEDAVYEALASIPDVQKLDGNTMFMGWEVDEFDPEVMAANGTAKLYLVLDTKSIARLLKAAGSQAHPPVLAGVKFKRVARSQPTGKRK